MKTGVYYPLRLDALSSGWRAGCVGDFAKEIVPGFASGEHNQTGDGVAHLRPMNIDRDGKIDLSLTKFVATQKDHRRLTVGDVLFNNTNSPELVGKTAAVSVTGDFAFSNHMTRIRFADNVLPKFGALQLHFLWMRGYFKYNCVKHVNQASVSSRALALGVPFVWAPLAEQEHIVAEVEKQFSRLDEAVANLKRVKANAKRLASAILVEAVAGRLVPSMGASWRTTQVCEAGEVVLGRQRAPQYLTGRWSRKYLRVANIKDDTLDYSDVETMDFDEAHFAKYQLTPGDILVSEGQSPELLGQSAIFRGFTEPLCFQKTLHRFRARPGTTTPEFAQIVFRSHVHSGVFRRLGSITTNIAHLTLEKFKAAPFPLPPLDEQHRIVAEVDRRLSIVRAVRAEVDASLMRAQSLRQAVLARAFSSAPLAAEMTLRSRTAAVSNAA